MVEPTGVERKLAAILCADVAGYSRLMGRSSDVSSADAVFPVSSVGAGAEEDGASSMASVVR